MRVMALDIGQRRIGIAISDPDERIATPLCVMSTIEVLQKGPAFKALLCDWEPELFLCGLPYTLAGKEGIQAASIRELAKAVSASYNIPCVFTDERLSSQQAKRNLREEGMTEKEMRGKIDMIAAGLFLQTWLDARKP